MLKYPTMQYLAKCSFEDRIRVTQSPDVFTIDFVRARILVEKIALLSIGKELITKS